MGQSSTDLTGSWTVHLPDGSTAPETATIVVGIVPDKYIFTDEKGETSDGEFISPTLLWASGFGLYGFVIDDGNTLMWRHNNTCWLRQR